MNQAIKILAVIPARGGSKSVPRKNIKILAGKPLIAWTIEEAKKTRHPMRVIVSTDDKKIAAIAKKCGAEVPFLRPAEISGDLATDVQFLTHALDFLKEKEGFEPDIVLRLPPTSPLRTTAHIDESIDLLLSDPEADAVRPITEAPKHPYKMWRVNKDSPYLESFLPESFTNIKDAHNLPRQIFPVAYVHTGALDAMRPHTIRELKSTSGRNTRYFFMKPEDSINIDHQIDFAFAEFLMQKRIAYNA
jgi:CMP-N,N'-diacetyllegionaminic acid synthase